MSVKNLKNGFLECLKFSNAFQLLLAHTIFRRTKFIPYLKNGMEILVDHAGGDTNSIRACLVTKMYGPFIDYLKKKNTKRPFSIIDLGANAGGFSLMLKDKKIEISKIVAVEMNPLTFSRMQLNLLTNLGPSAICLNRIVAAEHGFLKVPYSRGTTGQSVYDAVDEDSSNFEVEKVTFESLVEVYFENGVDLLKCDIEGSEWELFQGRTLEIIGNCKYLIIEIHPTREKSVEDFKSILDSIDMQEVKINDKAEPDVFLFENTKFKI